MRFIKLTSAVISLNMIFCAVSVPAFAEEKFENSVTELKESAYNSTKQNFTKIDLRKYANRGFEDETEGDHKGGWTDQGINDMRVFTHYGDVEFANVQFDVINPEKNNDKSVVVIQGQNDPELKNSVEIDIGGRKASGVYFLHSAAWLTSDYVATYTYNYTDGTSAALDLYDGVHIINFWGEDSGKFCIPIWSGTSAYARAGTISMHMFAMSNPYPEKAIKSLTLSTLGDEAYVMVTAITLTDSGPYLPAQDNGYLINSTGKYSYNYEKGSAEKRAGSPLDMSGFLDAPAGKHGALTVNGDKFRFADGTEIKFWGTNVIGNSCFPEKETAQMLAREIAQCGYNIVRFAEFDDDILSADKKTVDTDKLDKMAYFINCLEERGIYSYIAVTSNRKAASDTDAADISDVSDGFKLKGFFDKGLIEEQKQFIKQIFEYKSPYSGKTIGKTDGVVMIELMDSNTMFEYTSGYSDFSAKKGTYRQIINEKFKEFLIKKYGNNTDLTKIWNGQWDYQEADTKTIELKSVWRDFFYSKEKITDIQEFFADIQLNYYTEMKNFIKDMGIEALVTCNTNTIKRIDTGDSLVNSKTDFVARRSGWSKPSNKNTKLDEPAIIDHYNSMAGDEYGGMLGELAKGRILGSPYVVSAWHVLETNPYMAQVPVMMAAMSAQQGWNALQYSFVDDDFNFNSNTIDDFYSSYNSPIKTAMAPLAAAAFYTLSESENVNGTGFSEKEAYSFKNMQEYTQEMLLSKGNAAEYPNRYLTKYNQYAGITNRDLLIGKSGILITEKDSGIKYTNGYNDRVLENNLFKWNIKEETFFLNGEKVEFFAGTPNGRTALKDMEFETDNDNAVLGIMSLDGENISSSKHMLLTAAAKARNTGETSVQNLGEIMDSNPKKTGMVKEKGTAPIIAEQITGEVTLLIKGGFDIYTLSSSGERKKKVRSTETKDGYCKFSLLEGDECMQYEIVGR